jgi:hypothetical protein
MLKCLRDDFGERTMPDAIQSAALRETYPDEWVTAEVSSVDDANLTVGWGASCIIQTRRSSLRRSSPTAPSI